MFGKQESNEFRIPTELAALEKQLAGLTAAPVRVDRDRLMFEAGRAAGARIEDQGSRSQLPLRSRFWPMATATMTAAAIVLAAMLMWPRDRQTEGGQMVASHAGPTRLQTGESDAVDVHRLAKYPPTWLGIDRALSGYLGIRDVALARGVDALEYDSPEVRSDTIEPAPRMDSRELINELLPRSKRASI
jgi:hypothetical protein